MRRRRKRFRRSKAWSERPIPGFVTALVAGGALVAIALIERRRPLRQRRESDVVRTTRNLAMAGMSAIAVQTVQPIVLDPLAERIERQRLGLLGTIPLGSGVFRTVATVLLLDYTLWLWHWINHRVPFFWRFHRVHHVDRDMDASTALRFHFGEMSMSVVHRALQFLLIGPSAFGASLWQLMLLVSIFFHHSNIDLGERLDRRVAGFLVTPRMHGIHHSDYLAETDSNWSSLFTVWDRIHGTYRLDVAQREIRIGVARYQDPEDVTFPAIVVLPLEGTDEDWIDLDSGPRIRREVSG